MTIVRDHRTKLMSRTSGVNFVEPETGLKVALVLVPKTLGFDQETWIHLAFFLTYTFCLYNFCMP